MRSLSCAALIRYRATAMVGRASKTGAGRFMRKGYLSVHAPTTHHHFPLGMPQSFGTAAPPTR